MTDEKRKSIKFWCSLAAPLVVGIIVFFVTVFPVTHFQDSPIRMFAPERLTFDGRGFRGRVLGSHVLETEYGEIRLNRGARIYSDRYRTVGIIEANNFIRSRASHNLVVEGMVIPQYVQIIINGGGQLAHLRLYDREVILSDVLLRVNNFNFNHSTADIAMGGGPVSAYIALMDSTQIRFGERASRSLFIYREDERWRLRDAHFGFQVKLSDETEFVEYREITFRPHWGEFIEGVRVE